MEQTAATYDSVQMRYLGHGPSETGLAAKLRRESAAQKQEKLSMELAQAEVGLWSCR